MFLISPFLYSFSFDSETRPGLILDCSGAFKLMCVVRVMQFILSKWKRYVVNIYLTAVRSFWFGKIFINWIIIGKKNLNHSRNFPKLNNKIGIVELKFSINSSYSYIYSYEYICANKAIKTVKHFHEKHFASLTHVAPARIPYHNILPNYWEKF